MNAFKRLLSRMCKSQKRQQGSAAAIFPTWIEDRRRHRGEDDRNYKTIAGKDNAIGVGTLDAARLPEDLDLSKSWN